MPEITKSADVRRVETLPVWHGHLTLDNVQAVYERIVTLLGGDKLHSWVFLTSDYERTRRMPDVRTSLTADITLRHADFEGTPYASISISNGWHHSLMTEVHDGIEARALPERRRPPWLKITHDRLEVSDHAPIGARTYTVYAVEEGRDE